MASPISEDVKAGTFARVYLLYGQEDYQKDYYCSLLRKALVPPENELNLHVWDGMKLDAEGLNVLEEQARTLPFFADHRMIIVKDSCLFSGKGKSGDLRKPAQIKSVADSLAAFVPQIPQETVLVFVETEIDRRGKLYHAVQKNGGRLMECKYITGAPLVNWILRRLNRQGRQIQRSAMDLFLERTGGQDMYLIANELDKLVAYTEGRNGILLEDVQALTTATADYKIYELTDAICARNPDLALKIYRDLLAQKQSPVGMIIILYRQFEQFLQMRDLREQGLDTDTIAERMKIPPNRKFTISKGLRATASYTLKDLERMAALCGQANQDVVSGKMEAELAAQLLITQCASRTLERQTSTKESF